MQNRKIRKERSKGVAIVLTTLTLSVTLPLAGLAFDVGTLYLIKSKLSSAVDAAALAGARALGQGADDAAQASNAVTTAGNFFNANFPTGYWHTSNVQQAASVDSTSTPNYRSVNVNASVQAPLYFLRVFNQQFATVAATSRAGRRDALVVLVLDRSSSMNGTVPGTGKTACQLMKTDAADFVNYFAPGRDQLGMIVFGSTSYAYLSTTSFTTPDANGNTLQSLIGQITCGGNTASAEALARAYQELQRVNNANRMNVVVFMTDGRPNGVTADFTALRLHPTTCDVGGNPLVGVLSQWAGGALATGSTAGLMNYLTNSISSPNEGAIAAGAGCQFQGNLANVRNDISGMPATDIYGNGLTGPYSVENTAWPYNGLPANLVGVSSPQQVVVASTNALDNQASAIRNDPNLTPSIYTIALEGDGAANDQPDTLLLRKIANDPSLAGDTGIGLTFYQQQINQQHGYFAEAPDASQLAVAFDTIATQITIRLAQ